MAEAMKRLAPDCDIVVMCAAVADYRPVSFSSSKIKKSGASMTLELERTEDILASLGAMKAPGQLLAGFAAETDDLLKNAEAKLKRKNLDWIVANDVSRSDRGMDSESNAVTMLSRDGSKLELPLQAKRVIAAEIISKLLESARAKRS
jgi:phosphopantothenoylcysteine decarboxylase/phosphopantothenate--cysteine ligase